MITEKETDWVLDYANTDYSLNQQGKSDLDLMRNKQSFAQILIVNLSMSYLPLWLYMLMIKELTEHKSELMFALGLAEWRGCSEAVHGEAGGCSLQLRVSELSIAALRHTGRPWLSKSFKIAQPGTSEQSYGGVIMCLGLCKCLSVLLDRCPHLSVSFYLVFRTVITIPTSGRKIIDLVMIAPKSARGL